MGGQLIKYKWYINLDEHGRFYGDLRREDQGVIFEIDENKLHEMVDDGVIRHGRDLPGLWNYLRKRGVIEWPSTITRGNFI